MRKNWMGFLGICLTTSACSMFSGQTQTTATDQAKAKKSYQMGLSEAQAGRYLEAEAYLREAASMDPNSVDAQLGLAALLSQTGRSKDAVQIYEAALKRVGERPEIYEDMAASYAGASEAELAIESLRKALNLRANMVDTPENRKWIEQDKQLIAELTRLVNETKTQ